MTHIHNVNAFVPYYKGYTKTQMDSDLELLKNAGDNAYLTLEPEKEPCGYVYTNVYAHIPMNNGSIKTINIGDLYCDDDSDAYHIKHAMLQKKIIRIAPYLKKNGKHSSGYPLRANRIRFNVTYED